MNEFDTDVIGGKRGTRAKTQQKQREPAVERRRHNSENLGLEPVWP